MKKLIIANWKMNPASLGAAERLLKAVAPAVRRSRANAAFCPPAPYIAPLQAKFPGMTFGAQDSFYKSEGPYTGATGPEALKSVGVKYVIVGHSERRAVFGETDRDVALKVKAVLAAGLTPVLCIGESLPVRRKGMAASKKFVASQLKACLKGASPAKVIVAYEPVWSISTSGSGKVATPKDAAEMIRFIKTLHRGHVIYGGSASSKNSAALLAYKEIEGLLVGGASLRPADFSAMLRDA